MLKKIVLTCLTVVPLSGCGGSSSSVQEDQTKSDTESKGRLFGGKCAQNQQWLANLESAGSVPADWQFVYDLVNHSNLEDYWGILSDGTTFSLEESTKWSSYTALLGASVVQGDYSKANKIYNLLLPLMEKMDLQCAVAVTGTTGLSSTVVP
jgi:hypothetical protein